jgi:hypothetical protein
MDVDPRTGLFSSSLVPQRTSAHDHESEKTADFGSKETLKRLDRLGSLAEHDIRPASDIETAFRHGSWEEDRERVMQSLAAANMPTNRQEKFRHCGSQCVVEYSREAGKYRVRANYCGDRFCLPCSTSRSKKVKEELVALCKGQTVRFATFTLRASEDSLQTVLDHLLASFKRLRRQKIWLKSVRAGTAVVEITRGKNGTHWHVHLHALLIGTWLDQRALSAGWELASNGSTIVDIRVVRDAEIGVGYVAKYAGKGWSSQVLSNPEWLLECVISLRGRRLLIDFGDWYARDEQLCKVRHFDWKRVGRLDLIYADAIAKKPWATLLLGALGFAVGSVKGRPVFVGSPPSWSGP